MVYLNFFPQESRAYDKVHLIACNSRAFTLFEIPEGIDVIFGKIIIRNSFILPKAASLDIIFLSTKKCYVSCGIGKIYITEFDLIPEEPTPNIIVRTLNFVGSYFKR